MATVKLAACLMATTTFTVAQGTGAVGLPDEPNAHTGKQLENTTNLTEAFKAGTPDLSFRLRYEDVSDNIPAGNPLAGIKDADELTLRTVLGYSTGRFHGFYSRLEFENVTRIGDDNAFNVDDDLTFPPGPTGSQVAEGYSLIPDSPFTEVNEAYLGWRSPSSGCTNAPENCDGSTTIKLGRQIITYDNHRWVGNIVWRQNYQTYDAVRIDNTSISNLSASYAYVDRVNRTFGPDSPFNKWEMDSAHFINVSYDFPVGKLVGYGYLLDFNDNPRSPFPEGVGVGPGITNFDSDTWGLRFTGQRPFNDDFSLLYELEWANQAPSKDAGPTLSDNNYYNIEFGGAFKVVGKPVVVKVGREVLEGNGVNALQTPFATIHAFNGWADKYAGAPGGTATPVGGLEDTSVTMVVKGLIGPSQLVVQYHDYQANTTVGGVDDYGTEWGILLAKPFTKELSGMVKYASFDDGGDGFSFDTDKFWVMAVYQFQ